jgi:hypothetical protein
MTDIESAKSSDDDGSTDAPTEVSKTNQMHQISQVNMMEINLECVNNDIEQLQKDVANMKNENRVRDLHVDLLVQTSIRKDKDIANLKDKVLDLEKRSMNRNVCVSNLPERPKEIPADLITSYLDDKLGLNTIEIEVAHRNGPKPDKDSTIPRPMIVQLSKRGMVDKLLKATRNDNEFNREDIRIAKQVPTELRHATAKIHHLAEFAKKTHPEAKVEVKDRVIYINNQRKRPPVTPPTLEETLTCDQNEIDIMTHVNFFASELIGLKGSTFRAFATPVTCAEDARYAYKAIARFPRVASSTHLITAYYTTDQEYDYFDDGDHGLGRHIFELIIHKQLEGVMIFLSRDYGGVHLGRDRFTIINTVVNQALAKFNAAKLRNPTLMKPNRLHFNASAESTEQDQIPCNTYLDLTSLLTWHSRQSERQLNSTKTNGNM